MNNAKDSGDLRLKPTPQDVVGIVDELLAKAVASGASDIHFEPTGADLTVKYRLDGVLNPVERLPVAVSDNVVARLKVLGGLLTYRNDIPQEGRLELTGAPADKVADVRLAVFPTIYGQRAVVRLFYQHQELMDLEQLGFAPAIESRLTAIAAQSQGVLLVTGPAGSGKSTTLAALLRYIAKTLPGKSIVTLEDPVEIRIEGVTQVPITPHGQMTFPTALRSLLRQDPQVLMIGEIRDAETARIAIEAGLTGHLLMSTMHSGTPAGALLRLLEMGIEPYQVTSSISAIVTQRLVRRLCDECKKVCEEPVHRGMGLGSATHNSALGVPFQPMNHRQDADATKPHGQDARATSHIPSEESEGGRFEAVGCPACLSTGFRGRVLIAEMVQLDNDLRKAILGKADLEELEALLKAKGHTTILADGRRLVGSGQTTEAELGKVCGIVAQGESSICQE